MTTCFFFDMSQAKEIAKHFIESFISEFSFKFKHSIQYNISFNCLHFIVLTRFIIYSCHLHLFCITTSFILCNSTCVTNFSPTKTSLQSKQFFVISRMVDHHFFGKIIIENIQFVSKYLLFFSKQIVRTSNPISQTKSKIKKYFIGICSYSKENKFYRTTYNQ